MPEAPRWRPLDSLTTATSRALQDIRARQERHGIDRAPEYGTPHYVEAGDDGSRCAFVSSLAATQISTGSRRRGGRRLPPAG
jgi:hypothetical protein